MRDGRDRFNFFFFYVMTSGKHLVKKDCANKKFSGFKTIYIMMQEKNYNHKLGIAICQSMIVFYLLKKKKYHSFLSTSQKVVGLMSSLAISSPTNLP